MDDFEDVLLLPTDSVSLPGVESEDQLAKRSRDLGIIRSLFVEAELRVSEHAFSSCWDSFSPS